MTKFVKLLSVLLLVMLVISACGESSVVGNNGNDNNNNNQDTTNETLQPEFGANFNGNMRPNFVSFSELRNSQTTWVRGMVSFFQLYKKYKAGKPWARDSRILTYKKFQKKGYKTALAFRYFFKKHNLTIPEKGTPRFKSYMRFTDALLQVVLPRTDVITPGNEPIIEAPKRARDSQRLVDFYEAVAKHTHAYIKEHDLHIPIYIGSFTRPYSPNRRSIPAYEDLLSFAKNTEWVSGVDIHIHHSNSRALSKSMNYISKSIRDNQRIIITEFSLIWWWNRHVGDNLSPTFKAKYSQTLPSDVDKVWQYLDYALKHPRPLQEWNDWNQMTHWLYNRKYYICKAWQTFTGYDKFWLAFYSFKIGWGTHFSANSRPWILNSLLVNATVEHKANGDAYGRIWYMDDFKAIQTGEPATCK